jgi:hypothetical protein
MNEFPTTHELALAMKALSNKSDSAALLPETKAPSNVAEVK